MPPTVALMPIVDNPNTRYLQVFNLTIEEYQVLKLCASGIEPSKTTVGRRTLLRQLEARDCVKLGAVSKMWEPTELGETILEALDNLVRVKIVSEPAKVLRFPTTTPFSHTKNTRD